MQIVIEKTPVYLTPEECEQFITFQKHRALIGLLDSIGAFKITNGSVRIHFGSMGHIVGVDKQEHYKL